MWQFSKHHEPHTLNAALQAFTFGFLKCASPASLPFSFDLSPFLKVLSLMLFSKYDRHSPENSYLKYWLRKLMEKLNVRCLKKHMKKMADGRESRSCQSPTQNNLQWLPNTVRIKSKLPIIVFKTLHGLPSYSDP